MPPHLRLLAVLLLTGCVTRGGFSEQAAQAYCTAATDCAPTFVEAEFDGKAGCLDAVQTYFDCYSTHCETFDPADAALCVERWENPTCEAGDIDVSDCVSVWTDCDVEPLGACVAALFPEGE